LSQAAEFKTKEEVLTHLIANSPYEGYWVFRGRKGGRSNGQMNATFTKEGGYLHISQTMRPMDGDIKDLEIIFKWEKGVRNLFLPARSMLLLMGLSRGRA
jgi:hypothetical protein